MKSCSNNLGDAFLPSFVSSFLLVLRSILTKCCFEKIDIQVARNSKQQTAVETVEHGWAEEGDHSSCSQFVRKIMFEEIKARCRTAQGFFPWTMHMLALYLQLFCSYVCLAASKHMKI